MLTFILISMAALAHRTEHPETHLASSIVSLPTARAAAIVPSRVSQETGYRYRLRIMQRTVDARGRVRDEPPFAGVVRTRGPLVRLDFDTETARWQRASWYVTRDGGRRVTMVDEPGGLMAEMPVAALGDAMKMERKLRVQVTDVQMRWLPPRPCGTLHLWSVTCATLVVQYRALSRLSVAFDATAVEETIEYRILPVVSDLVLPFESFFGTRLDLLAHRDVAFEAQWRAMQAKRPVGSVVGLTVRRVEAQGRRRNTLHRRIVMDSLTPAAHPEALFEVPAGLRVAPR